MCTCVWWACVLLLWACDHVCSVYLLRVVWVCVYQTLLAGMYPKTDKILNGQNLSLHEQLFFIILEPCVVETQNWIDRLRLFQVKNY